MKRIVMSLLALLAQVWIWSWVFISHNIQAWPGVPLLITALGIGAVTCAYIMSVADEMS